MPAVIEHAGGEGGPGAISPERRARPDRHQHRAQAGDPQPDRVLRRPRPVGPADRLDDAHGAAEPAPTGPAPRATARARRRPATRRSATRATTGPDGSSVSSRTVEPPSSRSTTVPRARSATRSAASGSSGRSTRDDGRFGRRPLQLLHHQRAGVRGGAPVDEPPAVTGAVRAGAARQARVGPRPLDDHPGLLLAWARRVPGGATRPTRGETWSGAGRDPHPAGPPLQGERRGRGDVERHDSCTPRRTGTSVMRSPAGRPRPTGPTKASRPGGATAPQAQTGPGLDPDLQRQAGDAVAGGRADHDTGAADDHTRPRRRR